MSWHSYILIVLLLGLGLSALASEDTLQDIQVTAEKAVSPHDFGSSDRISSRELQKGSSASIIPQLNKVPGLYSTQSGGPGGTSSFFIRGTQSSHVAFTLDGLKLNDTSGTQRQFDPAFFTSLFLKDIEVHKGPQAVVFGSDAMGGLIEMKTRKGENPGHSQVKLSGGSFGTIEAAASTDWSKKNHRGSITANQFHTDGISRLNRKRYNAKEADSADITNLTSSSAHEFKGGQTNLLFSFIRGKNELDGAVDDNSHDHSSNDQYLVQQKTHWEINDHSAFSLRNGLNRNQRFLDTLAAGKNTFVGNLFQNEMLYQVEQERFSLLSGLATEHEEIEFQHIDRSFDLHSLFAQGALRLGKFSIQSGARIESHSRYGNFATGSGGVAYQHGRNIFTIQHSQGFKSPSLYQLYAPPLFGPPIGNRNLVPERNHAWEARWEHRYETREAQLALFQNRLSNLINFTNAGFRNQGRLITEGVEASVKHRERSFSFGPSFTHQEFKDVETAVLRRPMNVAKFIVSYNFNEHSELEVSSRWFDARKDLDVNGQVVKLNPYETIDLRYIHKQGRDTWGMLVNNLFNREYEEIYGTSVMPLAVTFNFGRDF